MGLKGLSLNLDPLSPSSSMSPQLTYCSFVLGNSVDDPLTCAGQPCHQPQVPTIACQPRCASQISITVVHHRPQEAQDTLETSKDHGKGLALNPASSPPMTWSIRPYCFASSGDIYLSLSVSSSIWGAELASAGASPFGTSKGLQKSLQTCSAGSAS